MNRLPEGVPRDWHTAPRSRRRPRVYRCMVPGCFCKSGDSRYCPEHPAVRMRRSA